MLIFVCRAVLGFITSLYKVYSDLYFTYLEINPLGKQSLGLPCSLTFVSAFDCCFVLLLVVLCY